MLKIKVKGIVTGNGTGCSPGRGRGSLGKDFLKRDVPPSSHKTVGGWPSHAPVQTPWPSGRAQLCDAQTPHRLANYPFSSSYYISKG